MSVEDNKKSSKKTILLAEDDNSMRRFLEITLRKLNYEVLPAEDGLAAMKLALENKIDAVIADALMPHLSGYDLCRILRQNPEKKHIPFVMLSGFSQSDADNSENFSADVYLTKDSNVKEQLAETLSRLLSEKS